MSYKYGNNNHQQLFDIANSALASVLLDIIGVNYTVIDKHGNYIAQNQSAIKQFSQGKTLASEIDPKSWKSCLEAMRKQERVLKEEHFEGKAFISIKQPVIVNNESIGIIVLSFDITHKKELEKAKLQHQLAEEKARAEEETRQAVMILAGSIAHDLRSPLFNISSSGHFIKEVLPTLLETYHLAEKEKLPIANPISHRLLPELDEIVDSISETVKSMNTFINDTLKSLSKVLTGEQTKEDLVICKLDHCIDNTLKRYPFIKHERELIQWQRQNHFSFLGNPVLFSRIIINLIKNALHQIHQNNKGQIFISADTTGEMNILRIKDTAGGAPPEVVEHLFEGYKTTKKEGTGVGLAFCRLTMRSFGGDITCHSVFGDYIEFVLSFPKVA